MFSKTKHKFTEKVWWNSFVFVFVFLKNFASCLHLEQYWDKETRYPWWRKSNHENRFFFLFWEFIYFKNKIKCVPDIRWRLFCYEEIKQKIQPLREFCHATFLSTINQAWWKKFIQFLVYFWKAIKCCFLLLTCVRFRFIYETVYFHFRNYLF